MNQKFPAREKLKQKKDIDFLFAKGKWQTCGNLRIITIKLGEAENIGIPNAKVGVSVSKKLFKKAVDRNRIKRLLREVYRLNKGLFVAKYGNNSLSMLFWISPEMPQNYKSVEENFNKLCETRK